MSIEDDLRRAFDQASLKRAAKALLTGAEWQTYRGIEAVHDKQRAHEERLFKSEYDTRVEAARKRLIDEAAGKAKKYNLRWMGADHFDKDAINRQAHRTVQQAHHRRLTAIDKKKSEELTRLIETCEARRAQSQRFSSDFAQAADRRSGAERRSEIGAAEPAARHRKLIRRREP